MYSIQELESLSGIKAHTIRIWEKRYNLLNPERTETNIRYYNDDQLRKLLNVTTLINHGSKISKVSKLNEDEIAQQVEELMLPERQDEQSEVFINRLVTACATYDNLLFETTFSSAVVRYGLHLTYLNVLIPTMVRIGLMWGKKEIMPAQEHFTSNLIRQKLFAAIDGIPHSSNSKDKYILFLPQHEEHEIGLLFAHYLLKQAGHEVIYLGQNVPIGNLSSALESTKAKSILFFLIRTWEDSELKELIDEVNATFKGNILISGNEQILAKINFKSNMFKINALSDFLKHIS